jgi:hypothetical protein
MSDLNKMIITHIDIPTYDIGLQPEIIVSQAHSSHHWTDKYRIKIGPTEIRLYGFEDGFQFIATIPVPELMRALLTYKEP